MIALNSTKLYPPPRIYRYESSAAAGTVSKMAIGMKKGDWRPGESEMLSKRLCPYTGVVNFYFEQEPHFAVGSVVKAEGHGYLWRCYTDPFEAVGAEADIGSAERRVADLCRKAAEQPTESVSHL